MAEHAAGDGRPRPWRGLLLAPLPLLLGVGGLALGFELDASTLVETSGGMHFTPASGKYHDGAPAALEVAFWSALVVSLVLTCVLFAWGRSGRAPHRLLAGLLGLQWLGVGVLLAVQWAGGVFPLGKEAGSWPFSFLTAGLAEAFSQSMIPACVLLGWLLAWLIALVVSARWERRAATRDSHASVQGHVPSVSPAQPETPSLSGGGMESGGVTRTDPVSPGPTILVLLATLTAAATLCERFWASRLFFLLAACADAPAWPPEMEHAASRWAGAHAGVLLLWLLLALVLIPTALGRRRRAQRTAVLVFVLLLWTGESLARRAVLHDAVRLLGATRLTSAGPVKAAVVEPTGELWPQAGLQAERAGLRASSGRLVPWAAGAAALEDVFARERADLALDASEEGLPARLGVTLGEGVRAEELACLVSAARARGVTELVLVGGPTVAASPALTRAVAFVYVELRRVLGPRGHAVTVRTTPELRMPPPSWVVVLPREGAPFVRPRDAVSPPYELPWPGAERSTHSRGHPRIPVVLEPGAPVVGLWSSLRKLGGGTFEVEASPACASAETRSVP